MRANAVALLSFTLFVGGCSKADCLPEPEADATPPHIRIVVDYHRPARSQERFEHRPGDPATTIEADPQQPVVITYLASDSAGLRSLWPTMRMQHTVGLGVERRYVNIDPVTSNCPVAELSYERELKGTGSRPAVYLTAVAENWMGETATLEPVTLRFP